MSQPVNLRDDAVALGFVTSQQMNIEREVYRIKYPAFNYAELIPVVTEGNPWARGTTFRSSDAAGEARLLNGRAFDMPYADVSMSQYTKGFNLGGIGYEWSMEEVEQANMEGINLDLEKAESARRIAEQFIWRSAMFGNPDIESTGLVNDPNVTVFEAAGPISGMTPVQVLALVNNAIVTGWNRTMEVELMDTVLFPTDVFGDLSGRPVSEQMPGESIMSYIAKNNIYTATTGQPLTIRANRALNTAGEGGVGRMVVYRRARDVLRFHLPMPHRFLAPHRKSSMVWEVAGIFRIGGTEIRLPGAVSYWDGVSAAPTEGGGA